MTAFLFIVVCVLVVWLARASSRTSKFEALLAKLTSRIFALEEELKQLKKPPPLLKEEVVVAAPPVLPAQEIPLPAAPEFVEPSLVPAEPELPPVPVAAHAFDTAEREGFSLRRLLNLEEALGTNWLNKLGIIILVIGVALFLGYEVSAMGPAGKIIVGYMVSGTMLAAGIFFERRDTWRILARAGIAGGWSLAYFTTYAMYHVSAAQILSSESLDLFLLLLVAAGLVLHTLHYGSQVVTGLAFLLAFTTVNLSRGNVYSLAASAILAAAMAWVAVRRRWFEMEIAGIAAVYFNHYLWLRPEIEPMHGHLHVFSGYAVSGVLLYAYWLIFRASFVLRKVEGLRQERVSIFAALLNPALLIAVSGYQSVHPELAFQFFLSIGAVEFVTGQLPITRRRRSAFVVLTALGTCLLMAAFPYKYSGARLSATWLAEAETLLLAGFLLREIVFRRLGLAALLVAWIQLIGADAGTVLGERMYHVRDGGQPGIALLFALAAAMFYFDWHWLPRRWPELIASQFDRLCFRRLVHLAAILALIGAWIAWPAAWTAVVWAALTALFAYAGRRWQRQELSIDAAACAALTVVRALSVNLWAKQTYPHVPWLTERLVTMALVIALLYIGSRWSGLTGVATLERIAPGYTWAASALAGLLAWYELRPPSVAPAWTLLGVVLLEAGLHRRSPHLRWQAHAALLASFARLFFVNLNAASSHGEISARIYTTAPLALAFYFAYVRLAASPAAPESRERHFHLTEMHAYLGTLSLAALLRFELDLDLVVTAWAGLALLLVAVAWRTARRIFLGQAILLAFGVLFRGIFHNLYERSYFPAPFGHGRVVSLGSTVALLFLALAMAFPLRRPKEAPATGNRFLKLLRLLDHHPEQVFFFIPFVLLTGLLAVEVRSGLVTLAWGIEAVAVFLAALRVGERSYRLAALGLLLLCVAKIVVRDVWGLAPRDRYLTFIVLGSALLAVSYLYTRFRDVVRQYL